MSRIVILDRENQFSEDLSELLALEHFDVRTFDRDTPDFYASATDAETALILVDVDLSDGEDGTGVCWRIRNLGGQLAAPIILTMVSSNDGVADSLVKGAEALLVKPFGIQGLMHAVRRVIRQRSNQDEEHPLLQSFPFVDGDF